MRSDPEYGVLTADEYVTATLDRRSTRHVIFVTMPVAGGSGSDVTEEAPLLATQFAVPAPPVGIVPRPRLNAMLRAGLEQPVTLVCGPAGSGKTSLLSSELAERPPPAWVSLGPGDDESGRFWEVVLTAVRLSGALPDHSALHCLAPPVRESARAFMPLLVNALAELPEPVVLVLDDVHLVRNRECIDQLAFLVLHAPPTLRLVLSARADPPLPLHLLRVRGHLGEIRAADLAFTVEEAGELFVANGLALSDEAVRTLWARTEGWSAGLRLAALSLQDRDEPDAFIEEFAGDDRAVGDYLLAEVLDRQGLRLRRFLLRTSIAERICGDLADAVTGGTGGADTLAELERTNGFVIGLDSRREWFRYHRLFAKLLRTRARTELASELPALHHRAALWHAEHGAPSQALHHAVSAEEWELASQLAARNWFDLFVRGHGAALRALVGAVPAEHLERDAELAAALACTALDAGDSMGARIQLANAEDAADRLPANRRRAYLETMALARLYAARRDGDFEAALRAADTLLAEAAGRGDWSHDARRALVHAKLGEAAQWAHRVQRARTELETAIDLARVAGLDHVLVGALSHLSLLDVLQLGVVTGTDNAGEAIALAERRGWAGIPQIACAHIAAASAALQRDLRPDIAAEHTERARQAIANGGSRQIGLFVVHASARVHLALGQPREALQLLARFEAQHRDGSPMHFERAALAGMRARAHLTLGEVEQAAAVLDALGGNSWPLLVVARAELLLASGEPGAVVELLEATWEAAPRPMHTISQVELAVLDAVARDELGDAAAAARSLERALELAERFGHLWPFIAAGRRMHDLLRAQIRAGTSHRAVVGELIAAFGDRLPARHPVAPLLEPLSEREQAILRFLPTTLSNREIASELFVTTNTVKTHLRSIYRKLDVARRRDAVERARELRLLSSGLGR
jgi:LuxR family maltose regulon positive regulatory protein